MILAGGRTCFSSNIKLIWIFNTYIPDGAEKAAQRANFPGHPAYDVLKNPSPTTRKIRADRTRLPGVQLRRKQKVSFEIIILLCSAKPL